MGCACVCVHVYACVCMCEVIHRAGACVCTSCLPLSVSIMWGRKQGRRRGPSLAQFRVPDQRGLLSVSSAASFAEHLQMPEAPPACRQQLPWPPALLSGRRRRRPPCPGLRAALKPLLKLDPRRLCQAQSVVLGSVFLLDI